MGGIYALERIARSSPADLQAIEEVLCLFVKNRASDDSGRSRPCEIDVNTVLTVLGRRRTNRRVRPLKLDRVGLVNARLHYSHLAEADLYFADLTDAMLRGAHLTRADLTGTSLRRTVLVETNLYQADLRDAVLTGAMAEQADLRGTDLTRADLTTAHLRQARMDLAGLWGANLTDADLTEVSLRGAFADNDTTWPDGFDPPPQESRLGQTLLRSGPITTSRPWHGRTTPNRIQRSPRLRSASRRMQLTITERTRMPRGNADVRTFVG